MAEHIYNDVPVMIPSFRFLNPELLTEEPWKEPFPVYDMGKKELLLFTICCNEMKYFMTDSRKALVEELDRYGLEMPDFSDFEPNPNLAHSVRLKMIELGACWSLAKKAGPQVINYYTEEKGAFIFSLKSDDIE